MAINYQEIIENLKDEDVFNLLEKLGGEPINKQDYILSKTICHHTDEEECTHKLYYYKNSHIFYCYSSCSSMSIFKLLHRYYEARSIEYDWYRDIYQAILNCSAYTARDHSPNAYKSNRDDYKPQKERKELPTYPNGLIDVFVRHYPGEWLLDGISPETMDKYNIRFSPSQNKIIIPHYNVNGDLVGIRGRALNPFEIENFGKYMPVQIEGKWYSHPLSFNLYGLNWNKENIKKDRVCFIFESEKSVMQLEGFEMKNYGVAACGSNINKYQIDLLMRYCAPAYIVVCFDKEEKEGEDKYFNKLWNMCKKYTNYCSMSFIYDRNNILKMKDSPTDRGEKKFIKLLEERVIVK